MDQLPVRYTKELNKDPLLVMKLLIKELNKGPLLVMKLLIKELNKDPLLVMKLLIAAFVLPLVSEETDPISTNWPFNNVTDRTEEDNLWMISRKIM